MKREVIRVEPLSTYLERWKAPTSAVTRMGDTVYVSGFPPFDPETVMDQMRLCLEAAGSDLDHLLKCNVYCTTVEEFLTVNAVYASYFTGAPPARIFINVPAWPGPFDIEIDCGGGKRHSLVALPPLASSGQITHKAGNPRFLTDERE
jgi:2-iminobutanoate/2-iminopropanoate deaminase